MLIFLGGEAVVASQGHKQLWVIYEYQYRGPIAIQALEQERYLKQQARAFGDAFSKSVYGICIGEEKQNQAGKSTKRGKINR